MGTIFHEWSIFLDEWTIYNEEYAAYKKIWSLAKAKLHTITQVLGQH